jgi:Tfp pilus assembly protein PilX
MTSNLMFSLMILLLVLVAMNLLVGVVIWWRHVALAERVTRLETHHQHSLGRSEVLAIHDRLASLEGQLKTTNQMLQTVQKHLLENE